ncbi:hypothetical protein HMPREF0578_1607 [Mobiluncus mulieris 28-1]|uniref:Uncharacterized protein n=2 Tax=Mobiluncus mulieris TaxID=2052 RepID=E0QMJ9_9ACTO|nr:hypothetical protein [Mobiluncus mulieris]EEJ53140.1 hypothetical protein HMPREF0577_1815 [Mobiluncus mulieris ATCC 35243]EEZ92324.1 hypothetical protein HMPREF0578_1607 [Mobiluncus mulieris 28-1]EFM47253.1 hypothetical protein HMPREF0580_0113 [Mobiluncus mulieris ATCC 35239]EFN93651.1 hypothetical protein HMPREF9278_0401 [Mobiluncus mulieris FB024-16]MBB5847374.1 hypothetical protein [Mobiluncus mulieris]
MSDSNTENQRYSSEVFAIASAVTAGMKVSDNTPAFPKMVAPSNVTKATSSGAFNSMGLVEAVNKLVGQPPFNVPAAGIVDILGSRTVANQGFAA